MIFSFFFQMIVGRWFKTMQASLTMPGDIILILSFAVLDLNSPFSNITTLYPLKTTE